MKESEYQVHKKQIQLRKIMNDSSISSSDSETLSPLKLQVQFDYTNLLLLLYDYFNIYFNL